MSWVSISYRFSPWLSGFSRVLKVSEFSGLGGSESDSRSELGVWVLNSIGSLYSLVSSVNSGHGISKNSVNWDRSKQGKSRSRS